MKKMEIFPFRILIFILINLLVTSAYSVIPAPVTDIFNGGRGSDFNVNWKFQQGDVTGGYAAGFDDSGWRKLSLPHDWSIEQPFNQNSAAGGGGGYLDGGIGWYRKTFYLPDSVSGKRITIQFEGIYMNSTVWINGQQLGSRPYGYSSFEYDLTPYIKTGSTANVIAVMVNNDQPNSRWQRYLQECVVDRNRSCSYCILWFLHHDNISECFLSNRYSCYQSTKSFQISTNNHSCNNSL